MTTAPEGAHTRRRRYWRTCDDATLFKRIHYSTKQTKRFIITFTYPPVPYTTASPYPCPIALGSIRSIGSDMTFDVVRPPVFIASLTAPYRYFCPSCKIVHVGGCEMTVHPTGRNEMVKERPCKDRWATAVTGKQASSKRPQIQAGGGDDDDDDMLSGTGQGRAK